MNHPDIFITTLNKTRTNHKIIVHEFPDGQTSVELYNSGFLTSLSSKNEAITVINCRIKNNNDFIILIQLCDVLNNLHIKYNIYMPYLFAARSDRRFNKNRSFDLWIYLKILFENQHMGGLNKVYAFDIHSSSILTFDDIELNLHRPYLQFETNEKNKRILNSINNISPQHTIEHLIDLKDPTYVVFPDKGASIRYKDIFLNKPNVYILHIDKARNEEGKIIKSTIVSEEMLDLSITNFLVVDDLCDGGGTFALAAENIRATFPNIKILSLYISHGVFSKGVETVLENYDHIYCTNSYQDINHLKVTQDKVF